MKNLLILLLVVCVALLTACGGGGGGGSSSMAYVGSSLQAEIDSAETAADLSEMAYFGSQVTDMVPIASAQSGGQAATGVAAPVLPELTQLVLDLPGMASDANQAAGLAAMSFPTEPEECLVDGDITYSVSGTETNFTISARFTNCDQGEGYIANGGISMSFNEGMSSAAIDLNLFTMEFPVEQEKVTLDGRITGTFNELSGDETLLMNLVVRNDLTGEMMMLEDYQVVVTDMTSYDQVVITGTLYSSENGFVVITTPEPLKVDYMSDEPYDGIYRLDGANGSWAEYDFEVAEGTFDNGAGVTGFFYINTVE